MLHHLRTGNEAQDPRLHCQQPASDERESCDNAPLDPLRINNFYPITSKFHRRICRPIEIALPCHYQSQFMITNDKISTVPIIFDTTIKVDFNIPQRQDLLENKYGFQVSAGFEIISISIACMHAYSKIIFV